MERPPRWLIAVDVGMALVVAFVVLVLLRAVFA
jgi:hypothetical protein